MKWINPNSKRKIKRCPYCNSDVSTPYKGVHDEIEIINGIPVKCRNNGTLNAHIAYPNIKTGEPSNESIKWFVEHKDTRLWWSGYKWTSDPNEAFGCDRESTADRYARFQRLKDYTITEHEFIKPL